YVASLPYPEAAAALIDGLAGTTGLSLDSTELRRSADEARQQVEEMMGGSPDHNQMIEQLEQAVDSEILTPLGGEIPSGDELAAELEKFLRGEAN
ncbi:MAG: PAC2 family protein, partial [Actinomycetota bacterium]